MMSRMLRVALAMVLASCGLASAAGATCSSASVNGVYGFVGAGTNDDIPYAVLLRLTFDSSTGTFGGTGTQSTDGVIDTESASGKYAVAANCTATGTVTIGSKTTPFSFVVTSTGGLKQVNGEAGNTFGGVALSEGAATCTNAGIEGSFGLDATGLDVSGAPFTGPLVLIGELSFSVNSSGDGVISGHVAGSENGTILTFTDEPITGAYSVNSNCTGTATITPKGLSALNFSLAVVNGGKELVAIETDADTVVTGTLQR